MLQSWAQRLPFIGICFANLNFSVANRSGINIFYDRKSSIGKKLFDKELARVSHWILKFFRVRGNNFGQCVQLIGSSVIISFKDPSMHTMCAVDWFISPSIPTCFMVLLTHCRTQCVQFLGSNNSIHLRLPDRKCRISSGQCQESSANVKNQAPMSITRKTPYEISDFHIGNVKY